MVTPQATPCIDHGKKSRSSGYVQRMRDSKWEYLHRIVYAEHNGVSLDSIKGKVVRHTCDNPRCVNTEHLLIGTTADNCNDRRVRGRTPARKLTQEQVDHCRRIHVKGCAALGSKALAVMYGVNPRTMQHIVNNRTY